MKVEVEGKQYRVEWQHGWAISPNDPELILLARRNAVHKAAINRETTTCFIRDLSTPSPGDATFPVVADATVVRYHKDTPNRLVAIEESLRKALKKLFPETFGEPAGAHDVSCRNAFWEAFRGRRRSRTTPQRAVAMVTETLESLIQHVRAYPMPGDRGDYFASVMERALPVLKLAARNCTFRVRHQPNDGSARFREGGLQCRR